MRAEAPRMDLMCRSVLDRIFEEETPFDLAGDLIMPSLLKLCNISENMHEYWCERGYFRIDPRSN
jgi:hypothetical protein